MKSSRSARGHRLPRWITRGMKNASGQSAVDCCNSSNIASSPTRRRVSSRVSVYLCWSKQLTMVMQLTISFFTRKPRYNLLLKLCLALSLPPVILIMIESLNHTCFNVLFSPRLAHISSQIVYFWRLLPAMIMSIIDCTVNVNSISQALELSGPTSN